jgi:hypothetical protein
MMIVTLATTLECADKNCLREARLSLTGDLEHDLIDNFLLVVTVELRSQGWRLIDGQWHCDRANHAAQNLYCDTEM